MTTSARSASAMIGWITAVTLWTMTSVAQPARPTPMPVSFDIDEIQVRGNSVLSGPEIEQAVYPSLGPHRTGDDLEKARIALETLYRDRGYQTVSVATPVQPASARVFFIDVTERRIGRLRVTGARYTSLDAVRAGAPSLAEGTVLNTNRLETDLLALNDQTSRTVTPKLRAGRAPDTVDVDLEVKDQFAGHASLELNNRSTADTNALRLSGSVGYDNLWQRGDSATLFFQVAPQDPSQAKVFSASYLFHIPGSRLSLLGSYLKSDSNVTTVGGTNVIGPGQVAGIRLLVPLPSSGSFVQTLTAGMDYKHFLQDLRLTNGGDQVAIEYYPLTATYEASWNTETESTDVTGSFAVGTRGLGSGEAAFDKNRYQARPNFWYFRGAASHQRELPYGLQAYARLQMQLTPDALIPNEQLGIGGLDSVRGYQEAEALADSGGTLQTELRSPDFANRIGHGFTAARAHVFADLGRTTINTPLPEQRRAYSLDSIGAGVRVRLLDHYSGEIEDAVALSRGLNTSRGSNRVLFRLYGDF